MQLPQGQRPAAGAQQHRRRQCGGVDRSCPQDPPGHLDRHLLHGKALGGRVRGDRPVRLTEVLAHRNRFRETDVDFPVVALPLCLDEVEQPPRSLGDLLPTAGVGRVLGRLVKLVKADRHRLHQDVLAATVQVGVGNVGEQTELGRQHLSGPRSGAFDRPAEVESLLHDVADELTKYVLVQRIVELAAQKDHTRSAHQRAHETEGQVDARERACRGKFVLLQSHRNDDTVEVGPVRPQEHRRVVLQRASHRLDLG